MIHSICIFEDNLYSQLYPLSLTRPVFELRCGILTLKEKIVGQFPDHSIRLFCRSCLKEFIQQENPHTQINNVDSEACLFVNGRILIDPSLKKAIVSSQERFFMHKGHVAAAFLKRENINRFLGWIEEGSDLKNIRNVGRVEIKKANFINYPWDLINQNPFQIEQDFNDFNKSGVIDGIVSENAVLVNKNNIFIGKNSVIKPGAILDAETGPVYIGEGATIMHNAVIEGPAFIGNRSSIKIAAKIYEGTSIGEVCKVGGEVEASIIHSFSNKQHDGFLGHAYIGQWVNLGADTNNSDLKNNYGSVKVPINGQMVDSGSMFVGLFMGDHAKTAINTMFNTGTVVGTMCNVFGPGFPPKFIPSFSWGGSEGLVEHDLEKALDTARQVMSRRKQVLSPAYEKIFRHIFESTRGERTG